MKLPALIFDFGNVVARFDYAIACARLGEPIGLSGPELLAKARDLGLNDLVKMYEAGEINSASFSGRVCTLLSLDLDPHEFAAAWADIFEINPSVASLIEELKGKGYTLVLGSNTNEIHAGKFLPQFEGTFRHFDDLVLSYQVGHIKPSASFYKVCVERTGAETGNCVFIDDLAENVEGANAAGLRGLLYTTTASLIEDLRGLGVEI